MCAANYSVFTFHTSLNLTSPEGGIERMRRGGGGEDAMCEATGNDHIMQRKKFAIFYVHGPKSIIFSSFSCTSTIAMFSVGSFLSCYEVLDTAVMGTPSLSCVVHYIVNMKIYHLSMVCHLQQDTNKSTDFIKKTVN